jgi:hypothetical protein
MPIATGVISTKQAPMRLRWLTVLLALTTVPAAHAQLGIYGKYDATRLNGVNGPGAASTTTWFNGGGVGLYYDFIHLGPAAIGADLRGDLLSAQGVSYRDALFGLRLAAKLPVLPLTPYIQGSVGVGGPNHSVLGGNGSVYSNKFQYQVLGGVDYTIVPHLDWRVAEVAYGRMSGISSSSPAQVATLFTISTGLVVRLP